MSRSKPRKSLQQMSGSLVLRTLRICERSATYAHARRAPGRGGYIGPGVLPDAPAALAGQ
jgi:hypothetical protein